MFVCEIENRETILALPYSKVTFNLKSWKQNKYSNSNLALQAHKTLSRERICTR